VFKPDPFACGEDGSGAQEFSIGLGRFGGLRGSHILGPEHAVALRRLFDGRRPHMELLYSAARDGRTAAIFHHKCDGRGPTFTVIRCGDEQGTIVGGWAGESWNSNSGQYGSRAWVFNLGGKEAPIVCRMDPARTNSNDLQYGHPTHACMFGTGGADLSVLQRFMIHSHPSQTSFRSVFFFFFFFIGGERTHPKADRRSRNARRTQEGGKDGGRGGKRIRQMEESAEHHRAWFVFLVGFIFVLLSLCVCLSASVAVGFDRSSSVAYSAQKPVETVAPHNASVVDMEVYTCVLDEAVVGKKSSSSSSSTKQRTDIKSNGLGAQDNGQGEKKLSKKCLF
jgi:hypothetical protein